MDRTLYTATDVKHYAYCPAIIYIRYVLGIHENPTEYMQAGAQQHDEKSLAALTAHYKPTKILKQPHLTCPRHRLTGAPDAVLIRPPNSAVIVDVKWAQNPGHIRRDHRLQLAAYALLVKCALNLRPTTIAVIYLKPKPSIQELTVTHRLLSEAEKAIRDIHRIASGAPLEPHIPPARCTGCNYKNWCPYYPRTPAPRRPHHRGTPL